MLSGLLFTAGYLGTAFAPNIQTAIFTLGIVAGITISSHKKLFDKHVYEESFLYSIEY